MEIITLTAKTTLLSGTFILPASKSESNRALILRALAMKQRTHYFSEKMLSNLSEANDTIVLRAILNEPFRKEWNVQDIGTACRFLTAFGAVTGYKVRITGAERMKQRPIAPLVTALRAIGFEIEYLEKEGFVPIALNGKPFAQKTNKIEIASNISSQFISALLMVAPLLPQGLEIVFSGKQILSLPYIEMTLAMMKCFCIDSEKTETGYKIAPQLYCMPLYSVESDWSAASYAYSFAALSEKASIFLPKLRKDTLQGDAQIAEFMQLWGVETTFTQKGVRIKKTKSKIPEPQLIDCSPCPDLAQTLIVLAAATGANLTFTGLESLRIKETDRIVALQTELLRFQITLAEREKSVFGLEGTFSPSFSPVQTYKDHRMSMAFAPLVLKQNTLSIQNPSVVKKSFPAFWEVIGQWTAQE